MQRFGFLRRQGSGAGDAASGDAAPGDAAPGGGSPSTRSASRSDARGAAHHHRADHDRDGEGTGGGSSDGGNSDDSRATTVIVKHGSRGSYGGGASGGLSGSDAFLDQWAGESAAGGGPWGDRGHAASRGGGGSGGGGGGPPPPPLGTLKRVDSRTHVDEALHTIPGLRARGSIELPLTRRLAFRKCRGVARAASRRGVPFLVLLVIGLVAFAARGGGAGRGDGAFLSAAAYARGGRRVGGNWEEAYDRRHRDEASSALGDDGSGGERVYDRSSDAGMFVEDRRGRRLRAASGWVSPGADARAGRGVEAPGRTSGVSEASEGKRPARPRVDG